MKKVVLFLAVAAMAMTTMAQQKVAILETVDKAQNVSYGVKLLLRSSLTAAISNTVGYEGYDRVDMASIAGEQEFQRTGNVSDNQIKEIGRAAGAAYVLVAEAARYDATSIIITAKLLDVETFGVKSSAVLVSGVSADEMQKSCETLAAKLLNAPQQKTESSSPALQNRPVAESDVTVVRQVASTNMEYKNPTTAWLYSFLIPGGGQVYNGEWMKAGIMFGLYTGSLINLLFISWPIGAVGMLGTMIWTQIDAPVSAKKLNKQNNLSFAVSPSLLNTSMPSSGTHLAPGLSLTLSF